MRKLALMLGLIAVVATPIAQAASRDAKRPSVTFSTRDGAVVVGHGGVVDSPDGTSTTVGGTARDDVSGIKRVDVLFIPCNTSISEHSCGYVGPWTDLHRGTAARLSCNRTRRSCAWSAYAPAAPGYYWVGVRAYDRAGKASSGKLIAIIVV